MPLQEPGFDRTQNKARNFIASRFTDKTSLKLKKPPTTRRNPSGTMDEYIWNFISDEQEKKIAISFSLLMTATISDLEAKISFKLNSN